MIRENMIVELNDKKEKTAFLKGLEKNNNIIKNLFEEAFINSKGVSYNINSHISNYQGRCIGFTSFNEVLRIEENELFKLTPSVLVACLKAGKTGITHYEIKDNKFILFNKDEAYEIGEYLDNKEISIEYLEEMDENKTDETDIEYVLENFGNSEFVDLKVGEYNMMLTHRLFPVFNKSSSFKVGIYTKCEETFYGVFTNKIEERNKKDEVTFSAEIKYFYKFLHL